MVLGPSGEAVLLEVFEELVALKVSERAALPVVFGIASLGVVMKVFRNDDC